jgi:hypothetical protein
MMDLKNISRTVTFIKISRWLAAAGLGALSLLLASNAYAACESNVSFRAQSSVTYKKSGFGSSSGPKPEALAEGRNKAIQRAFETLHPRQKQIFESSSKHGEHSL